MRIDAPKQTLPLAPIACFVIHMTLATASTAAEDQMAPVFRLPKSNLASAAEVTVSSQQDRFSKANAIDGDRATEWASSDEIHPWIKLQWEQPVKLARIVVCDRADAKENAQGGRVRFSDGSALDIDEIPPDGVPREVRFPQRTVTSLRLDLFSARRTQCGNTTTKNHRWFHPAWPDPQSCDLGQITTK